MKIIETNLSFRPMDIRNTTEQIVLHHSGVTVRQSVETIHNYHKNTNGWSGIGYHFYVRTTGEIYRGRPENTVGAHAVGANYNSIGICFEGNFSKEKMGEKQIKAGQELVAYLKEKYAISKVVRHRDVDNSECPGNDFPFNEIKNGTTTSSKPSTPSKPNTNKIDEDGLWGTNTTKKAQKVFNTTVDGIVSNQYLAYKSKNPGIVASFEWESKPGSNGSELIKAIQKKVGASQDGYIGPTTIKKMQKYFGTFQDGYVSNPSVVVKAFQSWLNKQ